MAIRSSLIRLKDKYYHHNNIQECRRILNEFEQKSDADKLTIQKRRLDNLLSKVAYDVPYYQDLFRGMQIEANNNSLLDRFSQIPFLSKPLIRENFDRIKNRHLEAKCWFLDKTGGSSGEPLVFIADGKFSDFGMAMMQAQFNWAGKKELDTHIKLWGSQRDILQGDIGLRSRISNWLYKTILLNSFCMTLNDMQNYAEVIQASSPVFLEAYADSAYELARYINRHSISISSVTGVLTSAGTLFPFMRMEIEKAFHCKVFNRYGSREMGAIACEKVGGQGLYVSTYTHLVEVVNEKGEHCQPGEEGEIIITCLTNSSFPFIRYRIGDRAIVKDIHQGQVNSCTVLENVSGRVSDSFMRRDGTVISSAFFIHFLGVVHNSGWLEKVQVNQLDYESVVIKMVVSSPPPVSDLHGIESSIKKVMGEDCMVEFTFEKELSALSSGKYQYTQSFLKR